jgi:type IV pilus assembly protein PilA
MIVVAIIGLLAAIAVPNFVKFQARSKQAEGKTNIKAIYVAEASYMAEKDTYTDKVSVLGFAPERANRYTYRLNWKGPLQGRSTKDETVDGAVPSFVGFEADTFKFGNASGIVADMTSWACQAPPVVPGSTGSFVATAIGNIDSDNDEYDCWQVGTIPGWSYSDQSWHAPGDVVNVLNDTLH